MPIPSYCGKPHKRQQKGYKDRGHGGGGGNARSRSKREQQNKTCDRRDVTSILGSGVSLVCAKILRTKKKLTYFQPFVWLGGFSAFCVDLQFVSSRHSATYHAQAQWMDDSTRPWPRNGRKTWTVPDHAQLANIPHGNRPARGVAAKGGVERGREGLKLKMSKAQIYTVFLKSAVQRCDLSKGRGTFCAFWAVLPKSCKKRRLTLSWQKWLEPCGGQMKRVATKRIGTDNPVPHFRPRSLQSQGCRGILGSTSSAWCSDELEGAECLVSRSSMVATTCLPEAFVVEWRALVNHWLQLRVVKTTTRGREKTESPT